MPKICPLFKMGLIANPADFIMSTNCEEQNCAWWTGEECAVKAIAKKPKTARTALAAAAAQLGAKICTFGKALDDDSLEGEQPKK